MLERPIEAAERALATDRGSPGRLLTTRALPSHFGTASGSGHKRSAKPMA